MPWTPSQGMPPRPRHPYDGPRPGSWDPQRTLDDLTAAQAADRVYDSMDEAFHARSREIPACRPALHVSKKLLYTSFMKVTSRAGALYCEITF